MSQELDFLPSRVTRIERTISALHTNILAPLEDRLAAIVAQLDALEARGTPAQDLLAAIAPPEPTPVTSMPAIGARVRMLTPMEACDDPPEGTCGTVVKPNSQRSVTVLWDRGGSLHCAALFEQIEILPAEPEAPAPTPAPPCWSSVPPTEPGHYWARRRADSYMSGHGQAGPAHPILVTRDLERFGGRRHYLMLGTPSPPDLTFHEFWTEALTPPA